MFLASLFLPTTGFFLLKNPDIQNYLVDQLSEKFSSRLNAKIKIQSAYYTLFNKLVLEDVYIQDQKGDSLIYSERITGNLNYISLKNRELFFEELALENARIKLYNDTSQNINIHFLIQALKRKDTTKPRMHIRSQNIRIRNSTLTYHTNHKPDATPVVDPNHLRLNKLNLHISELNADSGRVKMNIKNLSFEELSGLSVNNLSTGLKLNRKHLNLHNFSLHTPVTSFKTDSIRITHNQYEGFKHPFNKLRFDVSIKPSRVAFNDLAYFSKVFRKTPERQFTLSGHIRGKINNLKGDQVHLALGTQTELLTDFSLDGLPDISRTFMYIDMNHFYTGMQDLEIINRFLPGDKKIRVPDAFENLGRVRYEGNFTGFIDDFVAYGTMNTNLGEISTDLLIQPRQVEGLAMKGNLKTQDFDIGGLLENEENFGKFSMDIQVKGSILQEGFRAQTDGNINKLEINQYNYKNIRLDGLLTDKKYDGSLSIEDPNVQFDFQGGIDFSGEVPVFDFQAELAKAKLHQLNFASQDTSANLSLSLMSNFKGNSLDNASGTIRLSQGKLVRNEKTLRFDDLQIEARHRKDTHRIYLSSDYLEARLVGKYRSTTVYQSLKNLSLSYLPVFIQNSEDTASVPYQNDFELAIDLKHTVPITNVFLPSLKVADSSKVKLDYRGGETKSFHLTAQTQNLRYKDWNFTNINLDSRSQDTIFALNLHFDQVSTLSEKPTKYFHQFSLQSLTGNNESKLMVQWDQPQQDTLKGELISLIEMGRNEQTGHLKTNIFLLPGEIKLNNEIWHVAQSSVIIDSSSFNFNNLSFYHKQQRMYVDGRITKNPTDTLEMNFSDIALDYANILFPKGNLTFNGSIHGSARLSNLYKEPSFRSNLIIDTLSVNRQKVGQTRIKSLWNNQDKTIALNLESQRGELKTIDLEGTYNPKDQSIQFDLDLDKLRMAALNPILQKAFSDFNGAVSGHLDITGTTRYPVFNGRLSAQKTSFTIDYLQTEYHLTHILDITDNALLFNQVEVTDNKGNTANIDGRLKFNTLKNIDYTFIIEADELRALNTTGLDNSIYYGDAFASGLVNIQGNTQTKALNIDASLSTEEDTRINLPVGDRGRSQKTRFITFVGNPQQSSNSPGDDQHSYRPNLSGLSMNFDLEVTPQARTRLIFDPDLRDIIEASGRGNLNMEVDNSGDFRIYGNYTIEEGDYMFSLKNVINKEFEIEQGSQIIWNGKPQDADINITAVYNLRTSLNNLFMDTTSFYNKRIPVECKIQLTEKLVNPNIQFDINLPTADESTRARLQSAINTEEEMNKQFLSLLVLNTFMPSQQYLAGQSEAFDMGATGMAFTTSELLSNQLSHWLSQISNNWDIGVNYQPGDEISKDQMEVALSTQLLNNRLIINGNVGTSGKYQQASELVGDFRVDWKLTPNGKLRLKFFNRNSDRLIYEETRYIQGAGLFYREEFNSFRELLRNIAEDLSFKKKKEQANKQ